MKGGGYVGGAGNDRRQQRTVADSRGQWGSLQFIAMVESVIG